MANPKSVFVSPGLGTCQILSTDMSKHLDVSFGFILTYFQYDITGDGMDDVLLVTSDGELIFYTYLGELIENKTFQVKNPAR